MRTYWLIVALLGMGYGLVYGNSYILSTLYPAVMKAMEFSYADVAAMFTAFGISSALMLFPVGWMVDRIGSKAILALGLVILGVSNYLFSLHLGFWLMFMFYLLLGVGMAMSWVASITILYEWVPEERLSTTLGVMNGGGEILTAIIYGLLAPIMAVTYGLWTPFKFFSVLLLIFTVIFWILIKKPPKATSRATKERATADPLKNTPPTRAVSHAGVWILGIIGLCFTYQLITVSTFLPVYLVDISGFTIVEAGILALLAYFIGAPASIIGGVSGDKIGSLKAVILGCIISASIAILAAFTIAEFWLLALVLMLIRFGPSYALGAYYKAIPMLSPPIPSEKVGLITGLVNMIQWSPMVVAPILGGIILQMTGSYVPLYTLATIVALIGVPMYILMKKYYKE